jgi:hypothetical protein
MFLTKHNKIAKTRQGICVEHIVTVIIKGRGLENFDSHREGGNLIRKLRLFYSILMTSGFERNVLWRNFGAVINV